MSRERNYPRNGTESKSKRETKEEMDGQCGRMVGIINRKVAARNRGQERMEKNRLQCDQPSYRGRLKRERERVNAKLSISFFAYEGSVTRKHTKRPTLNVVIIIIFCLYLFQKIYIAPLQGCLLRSAPSPNPVE